MSAKLVGHGGTVFVAKCYKCLCKEEIPLWYTEATDSCKPCRETDQIG